MKVLSTDHYFVEWRGTGVASEYATLFRRPVNVKISWSSEQSRLSNSQAGLQGNTWESAGYDSSPGAVTCYVFATSPPTRGPPLLVASSHRSTAATSRLCGIDVWKLEHVRGVSCPVVSQTRRFVELVRNSQGSTALGGQKGVKSGMKPSEAPFQVHPSSVVFYSTCRAGRSLE